MNRRRAALTLVLLPMLLAIIIVICAVSAHKNQEEDFNICKFHFCWASILPLCFESLILYTSLSLSLTCIIIIIVILHFTDQGPPMGVAGQYRNVFTEFLGVSEEEVDAKLK